MCNATDKCDGLITQRRITKTKIEESILDYLVVCQDMFQYLENMLIDKNSIHTRYVKNQNIMKAIPSDHIPIFGKFNIKWNSHIKQEKRRNIIHNFRDNEGLAKYKSLTSMNFLSSWL